MRKTAYLIRLRDMSNEELDREESDLRTELVYLNRGRIQEVKGENPSNIKIVRRNLARVLTVKNERR